ncbi:MAG: hypothetical protein ACOC08_05715 [Campylobacterales bacterium]
MKKTIVAISCVLAMTLAASANNSKTNIQQSSSKNSSEYGIPNAPVINKESGRIITLEAVGMGAAPAKYISKAQKIAMAKRAAIVDGYRQMGEKLHGLHIMGKDKLSNSVLVDSVVLTRLNSVVKNAKVVETIYEDGLAQVKMELKIDAKRWREVLTVASR